MDTVVMEERNYKDIINIKYPFTLHHARMSMSNRAAQFAAFKALSGYDEEIEEATRLTDAQIELDENAKESLDIRLQVIQENITDKPLVRIVYFVPDNKKTGGKYKSLKERIKKIDKNMKTIQTVTNLIIPIKDICKLEGELFEQTGI